MVVILLIGIMAAITVPNLKYLITGYQRKQFLTQLNGLTRLAWQQALSTQKAHRIFFDIPKRSILAEIEQVGKKDKEGRPAFALAQIPYLRNSFLWPETVEIKQFFIGKDEMITRPGIKTEQIWFYIVPDGLVQEVIINMTDASETDEHGKPLSTSLVMNPFTGEFKEYEEFQKP